MAKKLTFAPAKIDLNNKTKDYLDGLTTFRKTPMCLFSFEQLAKAHGVLLGTVLNSNLRNKFLVEFWDTDFTRGHDGEWLSVGEARGMLLNYVEYMAARAVKAAKK